MYGVNSPQPCFFTKMCYNKVNRIYRGEEMELGERLYQARLEAGLSQKQLCGDKITRNMLSQIEHGTAKPSMATLQYLAGRLGKPLGYFLGEETTPNTQVILSARQAWQTGDAQGVLAALEGYQPDAFLDNEYYLMIAMANLALADEALEQGKTEYARFLLEQAERSEEKTLYTQGLTKKRLLLQCRAGMVVGELPDNTWDCIARGQMALDKGNPGDALRFLQGAADLSNVHLQFLMGKANQALGNYEAAIVNYLGAENAFSQVVAELEICYRELGNYKKAYEYACKQR